MNVEEHVKAAEKVQKALNRLYQKGEMNLKAIVGVPVGFVGAADSKEALHNSNIPNIIVEGPKGGTPIAVACVNSLIQHL